MGLKTILMSGVAAISLTAAPVLAQQPTAPQAGATATQDADTMATANRSYDDTYGERFGEWGDRPVSELLGQVVQNDAGETIGEINDFGLVQDGIVAIVGIGGFLGMGEHEVAILIEELSVEGDHLMLAGVTREQLESMPEYDEGDSSPFAADETFRSGYESTMPTMTHDGMNDTAGMSDTATSDQPMADTGGDVAKAPVQPMTENADQEVADSDTQMAATPDTEMAASDADVGWTEEMDAIFADIADQQIAELIGMDVASADGEVIGEIDNFALEGQDVVAIVGVGGFLGIGEHEVALSLGEMTFDGEKLVLSSITEDQLRDMPEYEGDEANRLPQDGTLRSSYNTSRRFH